MDPVSEEATWTHRTAQRRSSDIEGDGIFARRFMASGTPVGTQFQSQAIGYEPLAAVGVTIPAWPGGDEWYEVEGKWKPTVQPQPEAVK